MAKSQDQQWRLTNTAAGEWRPHRAPRTRANVDTKAEHVANAVLTPQELQAFLRADQAGRLAIMKATGDGWKRAKYAQILLAKLTARGTGRQSTRGGAR